jgi:hypothetical protein
MLILGTGGQQVLTLRTAQPVVLIVLLPIFACVVLPASLLDEKSDTLGVGVNPHIQPAGSSNYDAAIGPIGPHCNKYFLGREVLEAARAHPGQDANAITCGDRRAFNTQAVGEDSISGEFLAGTMGCQYLSETEGPFDKPPVNPQAVYMVDALGMPRYTGGYPLDSLVVHSECPELEDVTHVLTNPSPPPGSTAQPLLHVLNPDAQYDPTDASICIEKPSDVGKCPYVDSDLCALPNQGAQHGNGITFSGLPDFAPGYYCGRVELMRATPSQAPPA